MLNDAVDDRICEIEEICSKLPLINSKEKWEGYDLDLVARLQRLVICLDDPDEDAEDEVEDMIAERLPTEE